MCGVVGLIGSAEAAKEAFLALTTLQHRGQDAAGILTYDHSGFHCVKNLGLVDSVFTRSHMTQLTGNLAVGHVRYSTAGRGELGDVQPLLLNFPFGLGLVHNGNVVNCDELREQLKTHARRNLLTHSDSEVILNIFAERLAQELPTFTAGTSKWEKDKAEGGGPSFFDQQIWPATQEVFSRVNGSYSVVTLVADHGLVAFRDPTGIRPLIWGQRKNPDGTVAHLFSSEGVALSFLGYETFRDVQPGEVVFIDLRGNVKTRVMEDKPTARHCMFEWVYFSSPESIIDGIPVYGMRIQLGKTLAKQVRNEMNLRKLEVDIVVPVPETSRIAAIALSEELGIPYRELLIKNRYIKRTFILDSQDKRQSAVSLKLSPVRSELRGKRVILVDDSIVRGTTSKKIIELVRAAGAEKIYFVSTCPPVRYPCFYGIDFPESSELIATGRENPDIEKELEVDAVIYQDIPGLLEAKRLTAAASSSLGNSAGPSLCMACLDGRYPTDVSKVGSQMAQSRRMDRSNSKE